jgi:hypothetical protein
MMIYKSYIRSGDEWQKEIKAMNLGGSGKKSSSYNLRFCNQNSPRMMTKALQIFEILGSQGRSNGECLLGCSAV